VLSTRNFGFSFKNFRISSRSFVFSNRTTETSGVNSGSFCYRNFRSAKKHEVSNEVSVEGKPEKFSKFQAKKKNCVIQNFEFSLHKQSVLKNLQEFPIIQLKFRVKSTKNLSQSKYPRSFVFGKIYKFNTKLRDFHRNILGNGQ
jgi:hypothetical protein